MPARHSSSGGSVQPSSEGGETELPVSIEVVHGKASVSLGGLQLLDVVHRVREMGVYDFLDEWVDRRRRGRIGTLTVRDDGWTFDDAARDGELTVRYKEVDTGDDR